jgi:hypothetical protein
VRLEYLLYFWFFAVIPGLILWDTIKRARQRQFETWMQDENLNKWHLTFAFWPTTVGNHSEKVFLRQYEVRVEMDNRGYPRTYHRKLGDLDPYGVLVYRVERDR